MLDDIPSFGSTLSYLSACIDLVYPSISKDPLEHAKDKVPLASKAPGASEPSDAATKPTHGYVREIHWGMWTIYEHVSGWQAYIPGSATIQSVVLWWSTLPFIKRFLVDLWDLGGILCVVYIVASLFNSVIPSLTLYYSAACLRVIEKAAAERSFDRSELVRAASGRFFCSFAQWVIGRIQYRVQPRLQQRIKYLFNSRMIAAHLRLDLTTISQDSVNAKLDSVRGDYQGVGWEAFQSVVEVASTILEVTTQVSFLLHTLRNQQGGPTIAILCLARPLFTMYLSSSYFTVYYALVSNEHYLRMRSLMDFARTKEYRKEILGNGLGEYIQQAYDSSRALFGDTSDEYPWGYHGDGALQELVSNLTEQLPLAFLAYRIIQSPGDYALTSIALLEQITNEFSCTLWRVKANSSNTFEAFTSIKTLYEATMIESVIEDGSTSYPLPPAASASDETPSEKEVVEPAMKVEFRNVSFKYPGGDKMVIEDLSFTLQPGTLCVIVGENGCGKSSTINLLNRMYDVTDGEILIDDHPLKSLRVEDVRKASTIMYQDYQHFPFNIRENIALGNPSLAHDTEAVKEAARLGGALEFIEELPKGFDSKLNHDAMVYENGAPPKGSKLEAVVKEVNSKSLDLSGGQTQRLALSRTFMRSLSPNIRLLAYDEPSAALDPKAEFELFERLKSLRGHKTMIFVTHRFGYLTKYADHIIYMDKGKAVEQGNHEDLLAKNGLYAHLYNIQAQAFAA